MKKLIGILLLTVVFLLAGCEEENHEGYILVNGEWVVPITLTEAGINTRADQALESLYDYHTTNSENTCALYISEPDCSYMGATLTDLNYLDEGVIISDIDETSFKLEKYHKDEHKVVTFTGDMIVNDQNEIRINNQVLTINDIEKVTELDVRNSLEELLDQKELSTFNSVFYSTSTQNFKNSELLQQLDKVSNLFISDKNEVIAELTNVDDKTIKAVLTFDFYYVDNKAYVRNFNYTNETTYHFNKDDVQDFFEAMFDGGLTEKNLSDFCNYPTYNLDLETYVIDKEECQLYTEFMDSDNVTVEVVESDNPTFFTVHLNELEGIDSLALWVDYYREEDFTINVKYDVTEGTSLHASYFFISSFLADYSYEDPAQATIDHLELAVSEDISIIEDETRLANSEIVSFTRANGLLGMTYEMTLRDKNDYANEYTIGFVVERYMGELKITHIYTGDYWDN